MTPEPAPPSLASPLPPPNRPYRKVSLWKRISFRLQWLGVMLLIRATRWFGVARMGRVLERICALLMRLPVVRQRVDQNLDLVWPDLPMADRRKLLRGMAQHFALLLVEYIDLPAQQNRHRRLNNPALLADIRASGKGAVFVTGHLGQWEILRATQRAAGLATAIFYRRFNNPLFEQIAWQVTTQYGEPAFHKGRNGMREMLMHLRKGGSVLILVDQKISGAPLIDFMGQPAETALAPAEMAARLGIPLVPCVAFRDGDGFDVRFATPIDTSDAQAAMTAVNRQLTEWVREKPEQWFWFHRRWKIWKNHPDLPQ